MSPRRERPFFGSLILLAEPVALLEDICNLQKIKFFGVVLSTKQCHYHLEQDLFVISAECYPEIGAQAFDENSPKAEDFEETNKINIP